MVLSLIPKVLTMQNSVQRLSTTWRSRKTADQCPTSASVRSDFRTQPASSPHATASPRRTAAHAARALTTRLLAHGSRRSGREVYRALVHLLPNAVSARYPH